MGKSAAAVGKGLTARVVEDSCRSGTAFQSCIANSFVWYGLKDEFGDRIFHDFGEKSTN